MSASLSDTDPSRDKGRLEEFMPYQLSIASNAVSTLIAERYRKRFALKIPEWRIMAVLGNRGDKQGSKQGPKQGPQTQRDLTEATLMDKVAVNRACKVLGDRGLIARLPVAEDGRSHMLALTKEGEAIHAEVMPLALATERELFDGFEPDELEALREMLERIRERAGVLERVLERGSD